MLAKKKSMPKVLFCSCCWIGVALAMLAPTKSSATRLVTFEKAGRHGLERAWFAQVSVDLTRGRVSQCTLHNDQLFALSTSGTLQALNSETGETLWTVRVGTPNGAFAGPSINEKYVALTSGTRLYVIDRKDGHVLWTRLLGGAAAAAPALSQRYAFVGLMNGQVEGYPLEDLAVPVWRHRSIGRIFYSPMVTGSVVCWPTDRGYLYVAQNDRPRVLFRVETNDEIVASPAELEPYLYVASRDGYLYCLHERSGAELWQFSAGYPIVKKPVVVGNLAYVASEQPALHAVDSKTGRLLWSAVGATQFVAEGALHVYGMDRYGTLLILDKESGGVVGRLDTGEGTTALVNDQSDRIFLVSDRGLVQCLRERDSRQPTYYRLETGLREDALPEDTTESPFAEEAPGEGFSPPAAEEEPTDDFGGQFQPAEEEAEKETGEEENPFF